MAIENWPETGRIPVYLVGGAVRDRLLGRTPREYDFAFDADEATFLQRNPEARKVGKSVSVFLLRGQEFMPLEGTLEEDMRRRDLTINALAEDRDGNLLGHPDALSDLREGILRPASPTSFRDEPVRVFRLARMACELPSFTVHPEAVAQMRAVAGEGLLGRIPAERVGRELMKALASPEAVALAVRAGGRELSFPVVPGAGNFDGYSGGPRGVPFRFGDGTSDGRDGCGGGRSPVRLDGPVP